MSRTPSHSTPFAPSQQLSLPFPGSTFQPPPRSDLITACSDPRCPGRTDGAAGRDAVRSTAHRIWANSLQTFGTNFPLARRASWQLGAALNTCTHGALPNAGSGGERPDHAPRLISERFPGRPQPDFPEIAQSALNGSGFNVGGRWAPHKGPSPLQAGLSTCLIKS